MRREALLLLVAAFLHGLVHLALFAPWMGEDEPWHLEYASYVAEGELPDLGRGVALTHADLERHPLSQLLAKRRFPGVAYETIESTQASTLAAMAEEDFWRRVDWAAPNSAARTFDQIEPGFTAVNQPPLYYVALGTWLGAARVVGVDGPSARLAAGRFLSLLLYVATVGLAWALARAAFDDRPSRMAVALVVMLLPIHGRHAALVNNDVLAAALAALLLVLGARILERVELRPEAGRLRGAALVLFVAVLAVLTKMTAAGVCALVVMVALVGLVQGRPRRSWLPMGVVAGALGLVLMTGAVLYWNQQHNPALPRGLATYIERVDRGFSFASVYKLWGRFVGRLNWNSRGLPEGVYGATSIAFVSAVVLALVTLVRSPRHARRSVVLLCLAAAIAQAALVFLRGVPEGRYLTPALPALAVLVAAGLVTPWKPELRRLALVVLTVSLLALDAIYLWRGVALHHYLLWNA